MEIWCVENEDGDTVRLFTNFEAAQRFLLEYKELGCEICKRWAFTGHEEEDRVIEQVMLLEKVGYIPAQLNMGG